MKNFALYVALTASLGSVLWTSNAAAADQAETSPGGIVIPPGLSVKTLDEMDYPELIKNIARKQNSEMIERGYADASEEEVTVLERYVREGNKLKMKGMEEVAGTLAMQPSELAGTKFETGKFKGALASGGYTENGWTGITRIFDLPKLGVVKLEELDYISSGSGIVVTKEFINEDVNGNIATYLVKQSVTGKSISELNWFTDKKMYTLSVNGNISQSDKRYQLILELAKSVR